MNKEKYILFTPLFYTIDIGANKGGGGVKPPWNFYRPPKTKNFTVQYIGIYFEICLISILKSVKFI